MKDEVKTTLDSFIPSIARSRSLSLALSLSPSLSLSPLPYVPCRGAPLPLRLHLGLEQFHNADRTTRDPRIRIY